MVKPKGTKAKATSTKQDVIVTLLKAKVPKLFDREPTGSLQPNLVAKLAEEILKLK